MDCNDCNTNRMEELVEIVKSSGGGKEETRKQGEKMNLRGLYSFFNI